MNYWCPITQFCPGGRATHEETAFKWNPDQQEALLADAWPRGALSQPGLLEASRGPDAGGQTSGLRRLVLKFI